MMSFTGTFDSNVTPLPRGAGSMRKSKIAQQGFGIV